MIFWGFFSKAYQIGQKVQSHIASQKYAWTHLQLGLDRTGHMSFLTGQDQTPKFAGQVLPDQTKSGLSSLNILLCKKTTKNYEKKNLKKKFWNFFEKILKFFFLTFFYIKGSGVREGKKPEVRNPDISRFAGLPDRTWCPVEPYLQRTHSCKPFPHALLHAHRTCGSAIICTWCAATQRLEIIEVFSLNILL